ncbi:hypothetical protein [Faecalispora sporosphaeroides]|uniref:hypothetical protein n=1 Tax=Faecalispora sporosphaeroides TaxID=1549 RepID=UPI0012B67D17|nr:hypothetical protein [Faecalispora sporosphaeroides]
MAKRSSKSAKNKLGGDPGVAVPERSGMVRRPGELEESCFKNRGIAIFVNFFYNFSVE